MLYISGIYQRLVQAVVLEKFKPRDKCYAIIPARFWQGGIGTA